METIEEIKQKIEEQLSELVNYVNKDYGSPIKRDLLKEIEKKIKFYLGTVEDKELQLLLLHEFISGMLVGFGARK